MKIEFEISNVGEKAKEVNNLIKRFIFELNQMGIKVFSFNTLKEKP